MSNFVLFICGIAVTLIAGMGVITSQVFLGYHNVNDKKVDFEEDSKGDYL